MLIQCLMSADHNDEFLLTQMLSRTVYLYEPMASVFLQAFFKVSLLRLSGS